ncbi:MAG: hypothetical protein Q4G04_05700 [bacterium]|nr:hypothetical protein [bacterium]
MAMNNFNPLKGSKLFSNLNKKNNDKSKEKKKSSSTIKSSMYQRSVDMTGNNVKPIVYIVLVFLLVVIVFLVIAINMKKSCKYDGTNYINELSVYKNNSLILAKELYYRTRSIYSDFALGTNNVCGPFGEELRDGYYHKSLNVRFTTYESLYNYVNELFDEDLTKLLVSTSNYRNYDGVLYCAQSSRPKNEYYIGVESISLVDNTKTQMKYKVKEKYFSQNEDINCVNNCKYEYKENDFTLVNVDGIWKVKAFTLPY